MASDALRVLLVTFGIGLVALASVWPRFDSPNEYARIYAARAWVAHGSWQIDGELRAHGRIEDVAFAGGHYYSNKPPGLIWLAVPVVAAVHRLDPGADPQLDLYVTRLLLASLPALAGAVLLLHWVRRRRPGLLRPTDAAWLLLMATPFGVYAGVFFSHAAVGALLLGAVYLLYGARGGAPALRSFAAGLAAGLAVVSEYSAGVVVAVALLPALLPLSRRTWRTAAWLGAGAAAPIGALLLYNDACFGTPFTLSNRFDAHASYAALGGQALFGIGAPRWEGLVGLLASPVCGLLFLAPFLAPAALAPVHLWRRDERALAACLAGALWLQPIVMSGYANWQGGATFGPRYLVFTLPLWVLGLAVLPSRRVALRAFVVGAALAAGVVHLAARIVPPFAIDDVWTASTLRGWMLPALAGGLWNRPFGVESRTWVAAALAAVALLQGCAFGRWLLGAAPRPRPWVVATLAVAAVALALQLALGDVTPRQRAWLRLARPRFAVAVVPVSGVARSLALRAPPRTRTGSTPVAAADARSSR